MSDFAKHKQWLNFLFAFLLSALILYALRNIFTQFSHQIVGDGGDAPIFAWNLWWVKKSIIDLKNNPLHSDYIFYPNNISLIFHTLTMTTAFLSIPFQYFLTLTQVFNLFLIIGFILSGVFTYALCRKLKLDYVASTFGGFVFALAPSIVAQTIGHTNLYTVWFIPAILLCLVYFFEKPNFITGILLALSVAATIYNDFYVACFAFVLFASAALGFLIGMRDKNWKSLAKYSAVFVIALGIFLSPLLFELAKTKNMLSLPPTSIQGYDFYAGDLAGLVTPSFLNPDLGEKYQAATLHNVRGTEGVNYLGLLPLFLVVIAVIGLILKKGEKRYLIWSFLLAMLLAILLQFGPNLYFHNKNIFDLSLLYKIFKHVPVFNNLRVAIRFMITAAMGLAILSAFGVNLINSSIAKATNSQIRWGLYALFAFSIFVIVTYEFQTKFVFYDLSLSKIYTTIAEDDADVRVMEIPFREKTGRGWGIGEGFSKQQFAQSVHQKKLLSGYVSYVDESVTRAALGEPGIHYLATNLSNKSEADKNPELAKAGFQKYQVKYIVLSKKDSPAGEWYKMSQEKIDLADKYIKDVLGGKVIDSDDYTLLYQI